MNHDQCKSPAHAQAADALLELENKARLRLAKLWEVDSETALKLDFDEEMLTAEERAERRKLQLELHSTTTAPTYNLKQIRIASDNELDK